MTSRATLGSFFAFVFGGDCLLIGIHSGNAGTLVAGVIALAVPLALAVGALVHLAAVADAQKGDDNHQRTPYGCTQIQQPASPRETTTEGGTE